MTAFTDLEFFLGGIVILLGFFGAIAGVIVAVSAVAIFERDQWHRRRNAADVDARRQERDAQRQLRPRTGDVAAAPRLAPLADVVPFRPGGMPMPKKRDDAA